MTRLRPRDIKGNVNQLHELEALLNRELGANLDTNENNNILCRNELMAYLNDNNFRQHYGTNVNRDTIQQFIDRILSERNSQAHTSEITEGVRDPVGVETNQNENINLDFLRPTKVMQQATHYDNIPTDRLVGVYNERFDYDYTPQQLLANFNNDEQDMRNTLITDLVNDDESAQDYLERQANTPIRSVSWTGESYSMERSNRD